MAELALNPQPSSYVALALLVSFIGLLVYGVVWSVSLGPLVYLVAVATVVAGFVSDEDAVVMGAVMLFSLLVILDIALKIGVLWPV